ncbi:MAG TPA: DoxX family protein [Streptosporangiaceae bacterium]|jgi:putative oxidoreductase
MLDRFIPPRAADAALLVARIGVGVVFIAHGWQKLSGGGIGGTAKAFTMMGVPAPTISAAYAIVVEILGGAALVLGVAVPLAGLLLFLDMAGAFLTVHVGNGLFVDKGGFELVLVLGVASLLLAGAGSGKFGLDALFAGKRAPAETERAERAAAQG